MFKVFFLASLYIAALLYYQSSLISAVPLSRWVQAEEALGTDYFHPIKGNIIEKNMETTSADFSQYKL